VTAPTPARVSGPLADAGVFTLPPVNRERRLGVVPAQGGDVAWIPTMGGTSGAQFADDGSLVYQELSLDGKSLAFVSDRTGWIHV